MTDTSRVLTEDELAQLSLDPRDELAAALDGSGADAAKTVLSLARGHEASVTGLQAWAATVLQFLSARGGVAALTGAVGALLPAVTEGRTGPADGPGAEEVARLVTEGDREQALAAWDDLAARLRFRHDVLLDVVCLLMSEVYRSLGTDGLHACLRQVGEELLLSWMPKDVSQPPATRIRNWSKMIKGNFASVTVREDDEKFTITQHPCGSCARQILERGYPGPLDLAVVTEDDFLTQGHGGIPVYRTHIPVLHLELARERRGVPWPVVRCPSGLGGGDCEILVFKDPDDARAEAYVGFIDAAGKG